MLICNFKRILQTVDGQRDLQIEFRIADGEIFSIFGPSGVGKTMTLQVLAGLEAVQQGQIYVEDSVWLDTGSRQNLPPEKRDIAAVFQSPVLFPNMTVYENLLFAAKGRSATSEIQDLMRRAGIDGLASRYPQALSGGQRQRVVVGRALLRKAKIVLLDEPFNGLDIAARYQLYELIKQHHRRFAPTIILVSHLPGDVFVLADRVALIDKQGITAIGKPIDLMVDQKSDSELEIEGEILRIDGPRVTVAFGSDIRQVEFAAELLSGIKPGDKRLFTIGDLRPIGRKEGER